MHKLLEKCKKTIARKLTGSQRPISQWLPKPAKRKLTHFYNHKKRFGSRSRQQNLKLYDARCYRVVVFECAQVILPQVQTFLKGLKKFVRRLPSAMSRPTVLTYFYNLF